MDNARGHGIEKLPDPWLFDSISLLQELDNCREAVTRIPVESQEAFFASNAAISRIWDLRERLRELLALHRQMQANWVASHTAQESLQAQTDEAHKTARRRRHYRNTWAG